MVRAPARLDSTERQKDYGQKMLRMNARAYDARYGPDDHGIGEYKPDRASFSDPFQALKSLDCFIYQCSEGDVPKESLYIALAELRDHLCRVIVTSLPNYESATWG